MRGQGRAKGGGGSGSGEETTGGPEGTGEADGQGAEGKGAVEVLVAFDCGTGGRGVCSDARRGAGGGESAACLP